MLELRTGLSGTAQRDFDEQRVLVALERYTAGKRSSETGGIAVSFGMSMHCDVDFRWQMT